MSITPINAIHEAIKAAASAAGFTKRGAGWYADRAETVLAIAPQKSQYGNQYYINLALFFKALGIKDPPKEVNGHVRMRLDDLAGTDDEPALKTLLDFDVAFLDEGHRQSELAKRIAFGVDVLERCATVAGARAAFAAGQFKNAAVFGATRTLLQGSGAAA